MDKARHPNCKSLGQGLMATKDKRQCDPWVSGLSSTGQALWKASPRRLLMTFILFPVNSVLILGMRRGSEEGRVGM